MPPCPPAAAAFIPTSLISATRASVVSIRAASSDKLSKLVDLQRMEELERHMEDPPAPLFHEVRELILRKCAPNKEKQIRAIFETQPFGELERLVTQKLSDVVKRVAKEEVEGENWLQLVARLSGRSYEEMRVTILEFPDTDVFNVSVENCASFLDSQIASWDIDLATFNREIVLNRRLTPGQPKKFEFVEKESDEPEEEPGFKEFLNEGSLSGAATKEEMEFLKKLRFNGNGPLHSIISGNCRALETHSIFERPRPGLREQEYWVSLGRKGPPPRCINFWRLMALKNSCSLTAGKGQYRTGQETKAGGAKTKKQICRKLPPKLSCSEQWA